MGHRVPSHKGKCRFLHGHTYFVEVGVDDKLVTEKGASDEGMVIDFGDLKQIIVQVIKNVWDHSSMFYTHDPKARQLAELDLNCQFVDFIPTAENIAKFWFWQMKPYFEEKGMVLYHIKVWETPNSTATYTVVNEQYE